MWAPHAGLPRRGVAAILALALVLVPITSQARNEGDALQRTRRELAKIRHKLERARGQAAQVGDQVEAIDSQIASLNRQIREGKRQTAQLESDIRGAEARIADLEARVASSRALINNRARDLYKQAPVERFLALLEATSPVDFARRTVLVGVVADVDAKAIVEAGRLAGDLEEQKVGLEAMRARLDPQRRRLEERRRLLSSAREQRSAALEALQAEIQDDLRYMKQLERESRELEGTIRGSLSRSSGAISSRGFGWPVNGRLTSPFGRRGGGFHPGVDIGASPGTPIRAAKSGTVAGIGCGSGYGICTIVDHGGGVSTLYAHQSRKALSGGAVGAGQVIGYVGCTGACTGPHLHFEVRVDGSPRNPSGFLP